MSFFPSVSLAPVVLLSNLPVLEYVGPNSTGARFKVGQEKGQAKTHKKFIQIKTDFTESKNVRAGMDLRDH